MGTRDLAQSLGTRRVGTLKVENTESIYHRRHSLYVALINYDLLLTKLSGNVNNPSCSPVEESSS